MENLIVLKCGTIAVTEVGDIRGIITAVSIRFDKIVYELSYFSNGDYKVMWIHREEFSVDDSAQKNKIGFK